MPLNIADFSGDASPLNIADFRNEASPLNIADFTNYGGLLPLDSQPLTIRSRGTLMLNTGFATNSAQEIEASDFLFNPQDGKFYILYACTDNGSNGHYGLAQSASQSGPWTDLGALPGVPTWTGIPQCRLILAPSGKWSFFYITGTSAGVPALYQTAAEGAIHSTYTQTSAGLLSLGGAGAFDQNRISEVFVFDDTAANGVWRMLYMGEPLANNAEQIGMATATAPEGPWTKANSGNPIIANGAAGSFDATIDADPNVILYNGVYYIIQSYGGPNDVTGAGCFGMSLTTTTDWVTFTKRGIVFPPAVAAAGVGDCISSWAGALWWPGKLAGDNTCVLPSSATSLYWTYWGKHITVAGAGFVKSYQMLVDARSITTGAALAGSQWVRVEAESGDPKLTTTGTWTPITSGVTWQRGFSGTGMIFSPNTGDSQMLSWTGRRARVWLVEAVAFGIANIILDGAQVATFDGCYNNGAETSDAAVLGFDTGDIASGSHTLKIQVSGTKNASASGFNVAIDCWEFM